MLPELADGGSEDSVQKLDLNKSSSLKSQDCREDVRETKKIKEFYGRKFFLLMLLCRKVLKKRFNIRELINQCCSAGTNIYVE